jgi:hypothetical protein
MKFSLQTSFVAIAVGIGAVGSAQGCKDREETPKPTTPTSDRPASGTNNNSSGGGDGRMVLEKDNGRGTPELGQFLLKRGAAIQSIEAKDFAKAEKQVAELEAMAPTLEKDMADLVKELRAQLEAAKAGKPPATGPAEQTFTPPSER